MGKKIAIILGVTVLLLLAVGGGYYYFTESQKTDKKQETTQEKVKLTLGGSSGGGMLLKELAKSFEAENPNVTLEFAPSAESGDGIKGAYDGTFSFGIVEREPKPEEQAKTPVTLWKVAKTPIVFAVHSDIVVKNLTTEQVKDIYSGKTTNWSQVGGGNQEIVVLVRNEDDSSAKLLRKEVLGQDLIITNKAQVLKSTTQVSDALAGTKGAIAFIAGPTLSVNKVDFTQISFNGISPSESTIKDGTYKFYTTPGVVTKDKKPEANLQKFVDFLSSDKAKEVMEKFGYIPEN